MENVTRMAASHDGANPIVLPVVLQRLLRKTRKRGSKIPASTHFLFFPGSFRPGSIHGKVQPVGLDDAHPFQMPLKQMRTVKTD
jgi:hypothetical protein